MFTVLATVLANWRIVAPIVGVVLVFVWYQAAVRRAEEIGRKAAIEQIEKSNRAAQDAADKAEQNVLTCPPELWSREQRRCATKLR